MMKCSAWKVGSALVALLFVAGASGEAPLRLGVSIWPGYEPIYLAKERGLLDPNAVKVIEFRSATQVMHAIRTKVIDACTLTLDEAVTVTSDGTPLTVVLITDVSYGGDAIIAQADIENLAALRGKRIAVENTALGAFVLLRALEMSGLAFGDVELVRMEVSRHREAFESREIAASVCFEPMRTTLLRLGGKEVFSSREIPEEIIDVVAVRSEVFSAHTAALWHLGTAWDQSLAFIKEDPDTAYEMLGERLGQQSAEARKSYNGLVLHDRESSRNLMASDTFLKTTVPRLLEFLVGNKLIAKPVGPNYVPESTYRPGSR